MLGTILQIALELLKIFLGGGNASEKEKALREARDQLAKIRAAIGKAEETEGDTSDIEDIINKGK